MSEPPAWSATAGALRRALLIAGAEPDDARDRADCIELLTAVGQPGAARLVEAAGRLRDGLAPVGAAGEGGLDAAATALRQLMALGGPALDAVFDLPEPPGPRQATDLAGAAAAPDFERLARLADALLAALEQDASPEAWAQAGAALKGLQALLREHPPFDLAAAGDDFAELGARLAAEALRHALAEVQGWACAPTGSPALLHAAARLGTDALGPYARRLSQALSSGRALPALVGYACGSDPAEAEGAVDAWSAVLSQGLSGARLEELVDELGDRGRGGALRGLLALWVRKARAPERGLLWKVRDAGMDLGDLDLAWTAQAHVVAGRPDDKDEQLALGDLAVLSGRPEAARTAYEAALRLSPGEAHALWALDRLREGELGAFRNPGGWGSSEETRALRARRRGGTADGEGAQALDLGPPLEPLAPELAPQPDPLPRLHDGFHIRRIGARREHSRWGWLPALRGVEAIRGFVVSGAPVAELRVSLGGRALARVTPASGVAPGDPLRRKGVFNVWIDVSLVASGRYELELEALDLKGERRTHREPVVVAPPLREADFPDSDALVDSPPPGAPLETWINGRPSMTRPGRRAAFPQPPRKVLVIRADQLGDLVCSIPALRRLREILPGARLTGLLSPSNADLARALGLFDEVLTTEFPDDPAQRRRVMTLEAQAALKAELEARRFDLAIDLSENGLARPLLQLTGARQLYGEDFGRSFPFLDLSFHASVRDPINGSERVPAVNKMVGLVEWLGATLRTYAPLERRADPGLDALRALGLEGASFALLHTGARLAFSRWPHFARLAAMLLEHTALHVVVVGSEAMEEASRERLGESDRVRLLEGQIPFEHLDVLAAACAVFVGNDSGPKHLAALRGARVVSLHCARNNWNEWGQERGLVLSRRVPCAGCQISYDADECGRGFACVTQIAPHEVLDAVRQALSGAAG